jgi:hypothetical protein
MLESVNQRLNTAMHFEKARSRFALEKGIVHGKRLQSDNIVDWSRGDERKEI